MVLMCVSLITNKIGYLPPSIQNNIGMWQLLHENVFNEEMIVKGFADNITYKL